MNPKQRRFVEEYPVDLNAAAAARRAGYSEKYASQRGWRVLRNPEVRRAVEAAMAERAERAAVSFERVIHELSRIAFASGGEYFDWGPHGVTLKDKSLLSLDRQAAIAEMSHRVTGSGSSVRFKLCDKLGALKELTRLLGYGPDRGGAPTPAHRELSDTERLQRLLALVERVRKARAAEAAGEAPDDRNDRRDD